jgi:hypothetical protein
MFRNVLYLVLGAAVIGVAVLGVKVEHEREKPQGVTIELKPSVIPIAHTPD